MAQLSNRYGTAIFELALERGNLDESLSQALFLKDVLKEDDCKAILTHPRISANEKKSFLNEVFKDQINVDLLGLLHLVIDKSREEYIIPILTEFIDLAKRRLRKATAMVVSAVPLKEEQKTALAALLSRKLNKQVDIDVKVDPAVIGGLHIQVDGYYIDRTIRTRLHEIKLSMTEV